MNGGKTVKFSFQNVQIALWTAAILPPIGLGPHVITQNLKGHNGPKDPATAGKCVEPTGSKTSKCPRPAAILRASTDAVGLEPWLGQSAGWASLAGLALR